MGIFTGYTIAFLKINETMVATKLVSVEKKVDRKIMYNLSANLHDLNTQIKLADVISIG